LSRVSLASRCAELLITHERTTYSFCCKGLR
jgi:hypothetical protein